MGGRFLSRPIPTHKTKFESKLARSAQLLVVVHDPRDEKIDVNHKFSVGALLQLMVAAELGQAIAPTGQVSPTGCIVSNAVMNSMVGAHSSRTNGIKRGTGLVPRDPEGIGPTSYQPFMQ